MYLDSQPMSEVDWKKKREMQQKALQARLNKLPKDNMLVKEIVEEKDEMKNREEKYSQWELVDKLVCEAREQFIEDDKSLKEVVTSLAEALKAM